MDPKEEIRFKLDIADVIGEYLPLKPAGSGAFKGICPFHAEKTPSFHVSRERQIWKCFGCDKGGDVFAFVMEIEGFSFPEALRHLADKAGVALPEYRPSPQADSLQALRDVNEAAAKFYGTLLASHPLGQTIRTYISERNIPAELVTTFGLGAAPDAWDTLVSFLAKRGFSEKQILDSGLAFKKKSGSGLVDRFRNRLMIPLADATGRVVGFTGRVLPGAPKDEPKYMNSPETPIYHKGAMLYGLHLAKAGIRQAGEVIIVEGNLDVIASHKADVPHVVGSSGTALTETQLRTLARYTRRLVFCLDDDAAGFAAAQRVVDLAIKLRAADPALRFDVRCLVIPPGVGKDPDEIVSRNPETWKKIAAASQEVVEYYFQNVLRQFEEGGGAASVEARRALVDTLLPHVARLPRPDERHLYLLRISDATHVSVDVLQGMLPAAGNAPVAGGGAAQRSPAPQGGQTTAASQKPKVAIEPEVQAIRFIFGAISREETLIPAVRKVLRDDILPEPWKTLYSLLGDVYRQAQTSPSSHQTLFSRLRAYLEGHAEGQLIPLLDDVVLATDEILAGLSLTQVRHEVEQHVALIASAHLKKRRKQLEEAIRQAELSGDTEELAELMRSYGELLSRAAPRNEGGP